MQHGNARCLGLAHAARERTNPDPVRAPASGRRDVSALSATHALTTAFSGTRDAISVGVRLRPSKVHNNNIGGNLPRFHPFWCRFRQYTYELSGDNSSVFISL